MGDCYTMLGNAAMVKESYGRAAHLMAASLEVSPKDGLGWANLAFYHAKIGDRASAESDMKNARALETEKDVELPFMIVQALDVLGRKTEARDLLLKCMDNNLTPEEVDLAVDLKDLRNSAEYQSKLKELERKATAAANLKTSQPVNKKGRST